MKSLNEHNDEVWKQYEMLNKFPRPNGLECPDCKAELMDVDNSVLCSYPPKKNVKCSKCKFTGYAYC